MKSPTTPTLDSLVDLACRDGVDIRPTLLRVLTDFYIQKPAHSAAEENQYAELALGLLEAVDAPTRAAVAAKLLAYPAAPAAILGRLAGTTSSADADRLVQTEAKKISRHELIELFFAASAEDRRLILTNLDVVAGTPTRRPAPASSEVIRRLENAALQRNPGEFSRILERALGISRELAVRVTRDPSGEPIVVAARALGMTAAVLQRVLLFLNPTVGQSVERVYELARLYDELTQAAAERMLTIWRQPQTRSQPTYASVHWDDERRDSRSLSTPQQHRAVRGREEKPSRFKTSGN
jgi:uncharacterized protein DUF2336